MNKQGYTLIELVVVISLLAIVLLGGTTLLYRNLRSGGIGNVDLQMSADLRSVLSTIEKDIRFSQVMAVDVGTRTECLANGAAGYEGNTLTVVDLQGLESTYSLDTARVASVAAATSVKAYLTDPATKVSELKFTWYCQSGISDKVKIELKTASSILGSSWDISGDVSKEVNLLNSGIN